MWSAVFKGKNVLVTGHTGFKGDKYALCEKQIDRYENIGGLYEGV